MEDENQFLTDMILTILDSIIQTVIICLMIILTIQEAKKEFSGV